MKKSITAMLLLLLFVLAPFGIITASAETKTLPKENEELSNRLTIHFYVQINGVDTPLPGAEIGIYQAASLRFDEKGNACYELLSPFKSLAVIREGREVTFDGVTGTDADRLVEKIESFSAKPEQTAVTNENGDAGFYGLKDGIYVVKELSASGPSDEYELFAPYYIAVPYGTLGEHGYEWEQDVFSDPKTVIKPKESIPESSTPSEPPESQPTSSQPTSSQPTSSKPPESQPTSSDVSVSDPSQTSPVSSKPPVSEPSEVTRPEEPSDSPASGESAAARTGILILSLSVMIVSAILGVALGRKRSN